MYKKELSLCAWFHYLICFDISGNFGDIWFNDLGRDSLRITSWWYQEDDNDDDIWGQKSSSLPPSFDAVWKYDQITFGKVANYVSNHSAQLVGEDLSAKYSSTISILFQQYLNILLIYQCMLITLGENQLLQYSSTKENRSLPEKLLYHCSNSTSHLFTNSASHFCTSHHIFAQMFRHIFAQILLHIFAQMLRHIFL